MFASSLSENAAHVQACTACYSDLKNHQFQKLSKQDLRVSRARPVGTLFFITFILHQVWSLKSRPRHQTPDTETGLTTVTDRDSGELLATQHKLLVKYNIKY